PTVRYTNVSRPRAAPHRPSPRAAPLTSVSNPTGTPRARRTGPRMSMPDQPGFGVVLMNPYPGWDRRNSIGPNDAIPTAASGPPQATSRWKERDHCGQRPVRLSGGNLSSRHDVVGTGPHQAD